MLPAPLYGLAASFMLSGLVTRRRSAWRALGDVPDRVRAADRREEHLRHRQTARGHGAPPVQPNRTLTRNVRGRSGLAVQRGDRPEDDALQRTGGQPGVQRAVGVAEQP